MDLSDAHIADEHAADARKRAAERLRRLAGSLGHAALGAARLLRDTALPAQCAHCRAPVQSPGLCAACWSQLALIDKPYCPRLGIPFVYDPGEGILSMEAIADPPSYHRARAAVRYDDIAASLVLQLKYYDRSDLVPTMAMMMRRAGRELLDDADMIVPVPLHWRRSLARRYNQAGLLARQIGKVCGRRVMHDSVTRVKPTAHQVGLSRNERARNVQGAFAVSHNADVRDRHLVLVDDVLTSGATADACARALLRAGARQVDLLVFARVVEGPRVPI